MTFQALARRCVPLGNQGTVEEGHENDTEDGHGGQLRRELMQNQDQVSASSGTCLIFGPGTCLIFSGTKLAPRIKDQVPAQKHQVWVWRPELK